MSSLSGGLIPMKKSEATSSTLDNMAPLAPLSSKSAMSAKSSSTGFDNMFDDLLDAPVPSKSKKSKNNNKKNKKSSRQSSKYDDYDEPLSPNFGNSFDDLEGVLTGNTTSAPATFKAPAGVEEGDLDDSILGGLLGGGSSKPKLSTNTSTSSKRGVGSVSSTDEDTRPKTTSHVESKRGGGFSGFGGGDTTVGASSSTRAGRGGGGTDDDLFSNNNNNNNKETVRSVSPEMTSLRPSSTGSRRPRNRSNFSNEGNTLNDDDLFSFNSSKPAATSTTTSAPVTRSPLKEDFDDSFDLRDQLDTESPPAFLKNTVSSNTSVPPLTRSSSARSSNIPGSGSGGGNTEQTQVPRPHTTVGRRANTSMWGNSEDTPPATKDTPPTVTSSARPRTSSGSIHTYDLPPSSSSSTTTDNATSKVATSRVTSVANNDDSLEMDFDVDSLLPDTTSTNKTATADVANGKSNNSRSTNVPTSNYSTPRLPTAPLSSKTKESRSPSPNKLSTTSSSTSSAPMLHSNGFNSDVSRPTSSSSLSTTDTNLNTDVDETSKMSSGGSASQKKSEDMDVDIGFMPSFLEAGREPRTRRNIGGTGRPKVSRSRSAGRTYDDKDEDSIDALDSALGLRGSDSAGGNEGPGGRASKIIKDPFAQVDKPPSLVSQKSVLSMTLELASASASATSSVGNSKPLVLEPQNTASTLKNNTTSSSSSSSALPSLSPHKTGTEEKGRDNNLKEKMTNSATSSTLTNTKQLKSNNLTVTVDVPSDRPLSNPPTVTLITPAVTLVDSSAPPRNRGGDFSPEPTTYDNLNDSVGSISSITPTKPDLSVSTAHQQHNVTFSSKKLASSSPVSHLPPASSSSGSAKKILKKSQPLESSGNHSPLSLSSSFSKQELLSNSAVVSTSAAMTSSSREKRNSYNESDSGRNSSDNISFAPTGGSDETRGGNNNHNTSGENDYSSPVNTRRKPSWLSPSVPSAAGGGSGSGLLDSHADTTHSSHSSHTSSESNTVRMLQQKVDELNIQKETIEKYLRAEIDVLKNKAAVVNASRDQGKSLQGDVALDSSVEYQTLKIKVATLTEENARLKEEVVVEKIRHQKEINYLREKHGNDMNAGNASRSEEIEMMERRQKETITSLKKIHMDELAAVKQRSKDGMALEQLSSQITNTTGSLKLIEEQMNLQYRGIDAVREGQFEARERLLHDMETQAREKVEAAETESFKVKGMLSHMEQVVSNLRNQGGEERERLRQEHRRLEAMQASLESERRTLHDRFNSETEQLRKRLAAAEEIHHSEVTSRNQLHSELSDMRRKLEAEKKEFSVYVSTSVKTAERSAQHLKDEEARLLALRTEIAKEKSQFERQKYDAEEDLKHASSWKKSLEQTKYEIQHERESLEDLARELQSMSDILVEKDAKFSERERDLISREQSIREEKDSIDEAYKMLQTKENQIAFSYQQAEQQRFVMKQLEDEVLERKIVVNAHQRELAKMQQVETSNRLALALSSLHSHSPNSGSQQQGKDKENRMTAYYAEGPKTSPIQRNNNYTSLQNKDIEKELEFAHRTMQMARGGVAKISHTKSQRESFLRDENDFLTKLSKRV